MYVELLKNVLPEVLNITLKKEVLIKNKNDDKILYFKMDDLPEVLQDCTIYNLQNLIKILDDKYDNIEKVVSGQNGYLVFKKKGTEVKVPFSTITSSKNLVQVTKFLDLQKSQTDFIQFSVSQAEIIELKKYQQLFRAKNISFIGKGDKVLLAIKGFDEDTYEKVVSEGNTELDFKIDIEEIPSSQLDIKILYIQRQIEIKYNGITIWFLPDNL